MKTAIILAAGHGTKIFPYGETRSKTSIPIVNVPIVRRIAEGLRSAGIEELIVVTGRFGERVKYSLHDMPGVRYVEQRQPTGTAHGVLNAADLISGEDFLVVYGDVVCPEDSFKVLVEAHRGGGCAATALVHPLGAERPNDWICASVSEGRIRGVVGHQPLSHRLCGLYAFRKGYLRYFNDVPGFMRSVGCGGMPPNEADVAQVIDLMLEDGLEVGAVELEGYYVDVDKPWHIWEACRKVIDDMAGKLKGDSIAETASISEDARIDGHVVLGENSYIGPGVIVRGNLWVGRNTTITDGAIIGPDCVVGDNCVIEEYCKLYGHTVIGNGCRIRHAAEVEGVFMDNVYATHYSEFRGIIGESVDLGAATVCGTLRFDDGFTVHRIKGRKEIPSFDADATFIGDFVRTGVNVITFPGVKIGPYSAIGPGVIVAEDVPPNSLILAKQELIRKEWGPHRYGW